MWCGTLRWATSPRGDVWRRWWPRGTEMGEGRPTAFQKGGGCRNLLDDLPSLFSLPLQVLFIKKHESAWRNLVSGVTVGTTLDYPLKSTSRQTGAGAESQGECGSNGATVSMSLKYNPSSDWLFSAA